MHKRTAVVATVAAGLLSGCATFKPMALSKGTDQLDLKQESVAVVTMRLANTYKTSYQPKLRFVVVRADTGERPRFSFKVEDLLASDESESHQFQEAALSFSLPPGPYVLRSVAVASESILTPGHGEVPIYARFEVKPGQVVYLGRIEAVRRERKDDGELRAGIVIPLLDQAVTGYSGGTFDVKITDAYDSDVAALRKVYPALGKVEIAKSVLPPWHRPTDAEMN